MYSRFQCEQRILNNDVYIYIKYIYIYIYYMDMSVAVRYHSRSWMLSDVYLFHVSVKRRGVFSLISVVSVFVCKVVSNNSNFYRRQPESVCVCLCVCMCFCMCVCPPQAIPRIRLPTDDVGETGSISIKGICIVLSV